MHIQCQNCSQGFDAPYWQLGMRCQCPHCKTETLLARECVIGSYRSVWDVTFLDFVSLATDPAYQSEILPLLRELGFEPIQEKPLLFRDANGKTLTAEEAHILIQNDAAGQYNLYQAAMSLWR